MSVTCAVYPRAYLNPQQCKQLAKAIDTWVYRHSATRCVLNFGLDDLRQGELPQTHFMQRLMGIEGRGVSDEQKLLLPPSVRDMPKEERDALHIRMGARADSRHIELTVFKPESDHRDWIVANLRADIPTDLVQDVLIDGVSWNQ